MIDRAFSLLSAFDVGQRRLSLTELSRRSGIPASSALRLAGQLVRWGALERDEEGRYCVGLQLLEVASLAPRGHGLRQVAMPFMSDLAQVTPQHVQIVAVAAPIFSEDDTAVAALGVLLPEHGAQPRRLGLAVRTAALGISRGLGTRQAIGLPS